MRNEAFIASLKAVSFAPQLLVLLPIFVPMASSDKEQRPEFVRDLSSDSIQDIAISTATPSSSPPVTPRNPYQRSHLPSFAANFSPVSRSGIQSSYLTGDVSERSSIAEANRPGTGISSVSPSVVTRDSYMSPPVRQSAVYQSLQPTKPPPKYTKPSTMLTGGIEKPWKSKNNSRMRFAYWITYATAALGIVAGALRCFFGWRNVPRLGNLCQVMEDEFDTLNLDIWSRDIELGGFGYVGPFYSAPYHLFIKPIVLGLQKRRVRDDDRFADQLLRQRWKIVHSPDLDLRHHRPRRYF